MGDSGAGGHFICSSISPDLATSRTLLEDSQQTPGPCRGAGLGLAGLGWYWVVSLTSDQSGHLSRLEQEPGWDHASRRAQPAQMRLPAPDYIASLICFCSVKFQSSSIITAAQLMTLPAVAVAAAPSSQLKLWGCDDDDSAGTLPQSSVATLALVNTLGHCSCRTELGWARI